MKVFSSITVCFCLFALVLSAYGQECVQDYECGNPPYTTCDGGVNECPTTINGLGVDASTNLIYFAQVCRTDVRLSNITFKRVASTGGVPESISTRVQIPSAGNPGTVFDVVPDDLYFSILVRGPGHILTTLDLATFTQGESIDTGANFQQVLDFDIAARQSFACQIVYTNNTGNYTVDRFDGILGQDATTRQPLYVLPFETACTAVRKQVGTSDLFFATLEYIPNSSDFISRVWKGNADCLDCEVSPALLFSLNNQRIADLDVTVDRIYYATNTGVYSSDFTGSNVEHISWGSSASGVRILNDRVFWNSGVAIVSAKLDGSEVQQVNQFAGTCGCRVGFSGPQCATCNGQIQWWEGNASCVPLNGDGNPETCNFDYECNNPPYTYCSGTCSCRVGFTGPKCDQCSDPSQTVVWENEIPTCK